MSLLLGCIADDFTGASDLASFLVDSGLRTVQLIGLPDDAIDLGDAQAVVIALKSRTQETQAAVADSLAALRWLQGRGCERFYFKYCSTFDSTAEGNIGPVTDALLDALDEPFTIACPALPVNGRTVYNGYLFVNDRLLNESGMEHHPLTPMTDANLVRLLNAQTHGKVGLVGHATLSQGAGATERAFERLVEGGVRYAIVDTLDDRDLMTIGRAARHLKLVTGGSGLAIGVARSLYEDGLFSKRQGADRLAPVSGDAVVLSGSCSTMTQQQVAVFAGRHPAFKIDPLAISQGRQDADAALQWFLDQRDRGPVMFYATDHPEAVRHCQSHLGVEQSGSLVEVFMATLVDGLVSHGVRKFVVAGGETSGAVVKALDISALQIGPSIAPGVPLTLSLGQPPAMLALKSGNFGDRDFFAKALETMS